MSKMQTFYDQLLGQSESDDPVLRRLAALTRSTRTDLTPLQSELGWEDWYSSTHMQTQEDGLTPKF